MHCCTAWKLVSDRALACTVTLQPNKHHKPPYFIVLHQLQALRRVCPFWCSRGCVLQVPEAFATPQITDVCCHNPTFPLPHPHPHAHLHLAGTSAPIRIDRDPETMESPSMPGLYPSGEVSRPCSCMQHRTASGSACRRMRLW